MWISFGFPARDLVPISLRRATTGWGKQKLNLPMISIFTYSCAAKLKMMSMRSLINTDVIYASLAKPGAAAIAPTLNIG